MLIRAEATRVGLILQNGTIQENNNADTQQIGHEMAEKWPAQAVSFQIRC